MDKQQILCDIAYIVVLIVIGLITRYLVPYIKSKIGVENFNKAVSEIAIIVKSVQQLHSDKTGEEKLYIAVNEVMKLLKEGEIDIQEDQIRTIIEGCVKQMKIDGGSPA